MYKTKVKHTSAGTEIPGSSETERGIGEVEEPEINEKKHV